jgi:hypothetical protein
VNWPPALQELVARAVDNSLAQAADSVPWGQAAIVDAESASVAVHPYAWFTARIGDGVRLTAAGYLPPAVVLETATVLGLDREWIGAMNREDQTLPVAELRSTATSLGLVRKHRGVLSATAAGRRLTEDPVALWRHIAGRLPMGKPGVEQDAALVLLLHVAAGTADPSERIGAGLTALGWRYRSGEPLSRYAGRDSAGDTYSVLRRLGALPAGEPAPGWAQSLARLALERVDTAPRRPRRKPHPADRLAVDLRVSLDHAHLPIWRDLTVPGSLTLLELHAVLQTAMGWTDSHLHLFDIDRIVYGDLDEDWHDGPIGDEQRTRLLDFAKPGRTFRYEYDFGDSWDHTIEIQAVHDAEQPVFPTCRGGAGACPPEDCGGTPGYEELLAVLADPRHSEHDHMLSWAGGPIDPDRFDAAAVTELLKVYDGATRRN